MTPPVYKGLAHVKRVACVAIVLWTALPALSADLYKAKSVSMVLRATPQIFKDDKLSRSAAWDYYKVKRSPAGGFVSPSSIDDGYLSTGQEVLIVPLHSGGSGGIFSTLLWAKIAKAWKFVGYIPSRDGHLDVHIAQGRLLAITPIYANADANCCPSRHDYVVYTLNGRELTEIEHFTSR